MHTYNCTKGQKPLEPSHILTMRHTRIHMHSHSHEHTHTHNHIHKSYTHIRHMQVQGMQRKRERERQKRSHSINCVLELIGSVLLTHGSNTWWRWKEEWCQRWSMLESVHCIVFFETWALNATSCVHLYYTLLRTPVRKSTCKIATSLLNID